MTGFIGNQYDAASSFEVLGIDRAPGGWLVARMSGAAVALQLYPTISEVVSQSTGPIAIDMPIGLTDTGPRPCDKAARACLPRSRRSSIFAPPRRYMLGLDYAEANAAGRRREGIGLSRQAWHLGRQIKELDAALTPAMQDRIVETHPELIFHALNDGVEVPRKKSREGLIARHRLLMAAGLPDPEPLLTQYPRRLVKPDDVMDALACADVARRHASDAVCLTGALKPVRDSRGLRMEMWY